MRVALSNLGCKLNQAELDRLGRELVAHGHEIVTQLAEADLHVVNSCTVTHRAARDSRKTARRGSRIRPGLRTVVTGCWVSEDPKRAAELAGVDLVVPNSEKDHIVERLREAFPDLWATAEVQSRFRSSVGAMGPAAVPVPWVPLEMGRTRAAVKIEDGCNMRCAFCIIPSTRGRQVSREPGSVVEEIRALAEAGVPEVVVTGVQISQYRWEEQRLADLLQRVIEAVEDLPTRLRVTSIAPWRFDERLLEILASTDVCRHVHLSLQSGAARILKAMRRPYGPEAYAALVDQIRGAVPGIAVTTDVIVGFPGETEAEHQESLAFVERVAFAGAHVFSYSSREGTEAAGLPEPVDPRVTRRRTREMIEAASRGEQAFWEAQLGAELDVVWEERSRGGWRGVTDNYVRVWMSADEKAPPRRGWATLQEITDQGVRVTLPVVALPVVTSRRAV